MKLWMKLKQGKKTTLGYRELAGKMWFSEKNGKEIELSHVGNDESLQDNFYLSISIDKWLNDIRWEKNKSKLEREYLELEVENGILVFETTHIDILTVDKRALYIMVLEIAKEVEGLISEDDQETWVGVVEFQKKHQKILSLSYEEANEKSLVEAETMVAIEEPWEWDDE